MSETRYVDTRPDRDGAPYSKTEDALIKQQYREWKEQGRSLYGADKIIIPILAARFRRTQKGVLAHISKMRKEGRL